MAKTKTVIPVEPTPAPVSKDVTVGHIDLAQALVAAMETAKGPTKKTAANRKKNTPWTPKDGSPRLKLKRKIFHHGLPVGVRITNDDVALCNKLRPGLFLDGFVKVVRRRDKGIDIDYPIKTSSQRLRLVNQFGIRNFNELLQRLVAEGENPKLYKSEDEQND